jgi:hypothetical protein
MTTKEMTVEEQKEWERGHRHGEIPRRPDEGASQAYMEGYWAALRGPEEPKKPALQERLAAHKEKKRQGQS